MTEALNKEEVSISDFTKLNIVLGTILDARPNVKAKNPAYILKIDFGNQVGIKSTSLKLLIILLIINWKTSNTLALPQKSYYLKY